MICVATGLLLLSIAFDSAPKRESAKEKGKESGSPTTLTLLDEEEAALSC
jgi:hypothetical protein